MRIRALTPIAIRLPLTKPIRMAGVTIARAENLLVRVEADDGTVGWGEAASAPSMTGETAPGMYAAIDYMRGHLEGSDIEDPEAFARRLSGMIYGNAAARSAIDMAVHDLLAKRRGVPLAELLGGIRRPRTPVLWMLAAGRLDADIAEARVKAGEGFLAYKVKVGVKAPDAGYARDLERAGEIRRALGGEVRISADANGGYGREEAIAFACGARAAGLDFFEQPVGGDDLEAMQAVVDSTDIPIGADEGIHSIRDLERHHEMKAAHGGSLKILKLGGLREVMKAGARAETLGMQVNLAGKTAESSIASAAVAHLAATLPQVNWDVSVTNQYLAADIVRNPVRIRDGHILPPEGPGLGIEVDEDLVGRFAYRPLAG
jgi:muconate cycloisomerase